MRIDAGITPIPLQRGPRAFPLNHGRQGESEDRQITGAAGDGSDDSDVAEAGGTKRSGDAEDDVSKDPAVVRDLHKLREATGQVVGTVFYGTLMKMMRESELKGDYGHGGRGEEVFSAQLHDRYAKEMGGRRHGLADSLYQRLERQQTIVSRQLKLTPATMRMPASIDKPASIHKGVTT